LGFKIFDLRF